MSYKIIRKIHFYIAVILAIPLLILSITGALLVYGPELQKIVSPKGWSVEQEGEKLSLAKAAIIASKQRPDLSIWAISEKNKSETSPYIAWLGGNKGALNINPYNGEIITHFSPRETFEGWITALHRRLLAEGEFAKITRHFVSAIALLLIIELIIGLWIWLKPAKPFQRLAVKSNYSFKMKIMRLHQLTGIITAIFLFFVAFTGIAMYWKAPAKAVVEAVTFGKVEKNEPPKFENLKPIKNLEEAVNYVMKSFSESKLKTLKMPDKEGSAVLTIVTKNQISSSRVWIGDDPIRILHIADGSKTNAASWFWQLLYPIHVGIFAETTFLGSIVRFLWLFVALAPTFFVISGIWLYVKRKQKLA